MKLCIKNVTFNYEAIKVLQDITFEVKEGEVFGVTGPNGSGKTTLLKCIDLMLKPTIGTVFIDNEDLAHFERREIAKKIGLVPQKESSVYPFTTLDVVLMGRTPHMERFGKESSKDLEVVGNALKITEIEHLAERSVDELSGGEMQRVVIARALAQEPQVLLLDEPTLHLDVNHQLEILDLIKKLTNEKKLVTLLVSHDLNLASRYCDKLVILNSGKIYSIGTPSEVLTPKNIKHAFNVDVEVNYHPSAKFYNIILLSSTKKY
ncbi:MAG: ABC transporter ATP-binding protein [Candidatus Bathyarchaeota archaeon]